MKPDLCRVHLGGRLEGEKETETVCVCFSVRCFQTYVYNMLKCEKHIKKAVISWGGGEKLKILPFHIRQSIFVSVDLSARHFHLLL